MDPSIPSTSRSPRAIQLRKIGVWWPTQWPRRLRRLRRSSLDPAIQRRPLYTTYHQTMYPPILPILSMVIILLNQSAVAIRQHPVQSRNPFDWFIDSMLFYLHKVTLWMTWWYLVCSYYRFTQFQWSKRGVVVFFCCFFFYGAVFSSRLNALTRSILPSERHTHTPYRRASLPAFSVTGSQSCLASSLDIFTSWEESAETLVAVRKKKSFSCPSFN